MVAFTPKGGCPLKPATYKSAAKWKSSVAFTPKGGCPLKLDGERIPFDLNDFLVAFTPKGGCRLKLNLLHHVKDRDDLV